MNTHPLLLASLLFIAGATHAANASDTRPLFESRPPTHRPADPEEGVVVVSLASNSLLIEGVDTLIVDDATARYRLRSLASAYARDLSVFVGVLPEGTYRIHSMEERDSFRSLTVSSADRDVLGTFAVKRGQRCDLGRLVSTQIVTGMATGRSSTVTDNAEALQRFAPATAGQFPPAADCWTQPRSERDIAEAYARSYPVGAAIMTEFTDGRVAVPSGMGSVLIRSTDGKWSVAHSDGMEQFLYLDEIAAPEQSLVAVGELNSIVRLGSDGKLHRVDTGDLPLGSIIFIDGNTTAGWHIVHQRGNDLRIYHSASLDRPIWSELASTAIGFSAWSGAKNFWVWPTSEGFAYAITDEGTMRFYDYATKSWSERHTPKNNPILGIAHSPGGIIGVLTSPGGGLGGITASHYYSRDGARTWVDIPSGPYAVKVAPPRVLADGTILVNGGVFGEAGLHASKDGGKTWSMLSDRIGINDFYWNLPTAGLFNISKGNDGIEVITHSGDGGKTWMTEYLSVNQKLLREKLAADKAAEEAEKAARKRK